MKNEGGRRRGRRCCACDVTAWMRFFFDACADTLFGQHSASHAVAVSARCLDLGVDGLLDWVCQLVEIMPGWASLFEQQSKVER